MQLLDTITVGLLLAGAALYLARLLCGQKKGGAGCGCGSTDCRVKDRSTLELHSIKVHDRA